MAELNMGSILRKLNHKTESEVADFVNDSMRSATKGIKNALKGGEEAESGIAKKISSFEDNFINVWENPEKNKINDESFNKFFDNLDLEKYTEKRDSYTETMNNIQKKIDDLTAGKAAGPGKGIKGQKEIDEFNAKIDESLKKYNDELVSVSNKRDQYIDNVARKFSGQYANEQADIIDSTINDRISNVGRDYEKELNRRKSNADTILQKNSDINIPKGMSQEDAALYTAAQDMFKDYGMQLREAEKGSESYYKIKNMAETSQGIMGDLQEKAAWNQHGKTNVSSGFTDKLDSFMRSAVPIGVGGGLLFTMFNRGGNMSNSELYGQQQPYSQQ